MRKRKIGIFAGYYLPHLGGVERYVDKLAMALGKLGYDVVVVTSNHADLPRTEVIHGVMVYRLPIRSWAKNRYPIPLVNDEYKTLIQQVEAEGIDYYVVNTRFHLTSSIGAKMGKRHNKPVLLIEHGTDHFTVNNRWLDYFGKLYEHVLTSYVKRRVDRFYGVSKNCNVWLEHFGIHASGVFYNAIDVTDDKKVKNLYEKTYPSDAIVVAYAGRLIKEKGVLNLLDAIKEIKRQKPDLNLRVVVAGDGPLLEEIKKDYAQPYIETVGRLDFEHVMALYKRTDIFVYPSLYPEGLPTSILEAGLMGCAVIATPRGGTEEVIIDKQHGIITDGSVEDLRAAIGQLATDSRVRRAMGKTLQQRIKSVFNWDTVAAEVSREINNF